MSNCKRSAIFHILIVDNFQYLEILCFLEVDNFPELGGHQFSMVGNKLVSRICHTCVSLHHKIEIRFLESFSDHNLKWHTKYYYLLYKVYLFLYILASENGTVYSANKDCCNSRWYISILRGHRNFSVRGSGPKFFWGGCGGIQVFEVLSVREIFFCFVSKF